MRFVPTIERHDPAQQPYGSRWIVTSTPWYAFGWNVYYRKTWWGMCLTWLSAWLYG